MMQHHGVDCHCAVENRQSDAHVYVCMGYSSNGTSLCNILQFSRLLPVI